MSKKKDIRDVFLSLVPDKTKRILDIGCGAGGFSEKLKNRGVEEIVGIEKNSELCKLAKDRLNEVFSADIENFQLSYPKEYFDCIIYADILEHLIEPLNVLISYKKYLKDQGFIIASIPNIRYYKVILRLILGGTWDYMDEGGLLDKTHLRFFTLVNIKELFQKAGFEIVEIKRNIVAARGFKILNILFFNKLKGFLSYQYFIKAKKNKLGFIEKKRKVYSF
ncbi:MAG: class I SAM-dependent methyltransferase [Candidatus Kaelpia imicola]|nr:class I SAM-dependent methyltransferase [Candidatus Kaelpia imicola]